MPLELDPAIITSTSLLTLTNKRVTGSEVPLAESYVVPASATINLRECPLQELPSTLLVTGYTEATYPPTAGQFSVNYDIGQLTFHSTAIAATVAIAYNGRGSIVFAEDVNKLSTLLLPLYNELRYTRLTTIEETALVLTLGPTDGGLGWFNTTDSQFKGWNGTAIVILG